MMLLFVLLCLVPFAVLAYIMTRKSKPTRFVSAVPDVPLQKPLAVHVPSFDSRPIPSQAPKVVSTPLPPAPVHRSPTRKNRTVLVEDVTPVTSVIDASVPLMQVLAADAIERSYRSDPAPVVPRYEPPAESVRAYEEPKVYMEPSKPVESYSPPASTYSPPAETYSSPSVDTSSSYTDTSSSYSPSSTD